MTNLAQYVESRAVGQIDVEQDCGRRLGFKRRQTGGCSFGFDRFIAPPSQRFAQRPTNHLLVIDDEDLMLLIFQGVLLAFHLHPALPTQRWPDDYS